MNRWKGRGTKTIEFADFLPTNSFLNITHKKLIYQELRPISTHKFSHSTIGWYRDWLFQSSAKRQILQGENLGLKLGIWIKIFTCCFYRSHPCLNIFRKKLQHSNEEKQYFSFYYEKLLKRESYILNITSHPGRELCGYSLLL